MLMLSLSFFEREKEGKKEGKEGRKGKKERKKKKVLWGMDEGVPKSKEELGQTSRRWWPLGWILKTV